MKKALSRFLALYLLASCLLSLGYNLIPYHAWDLAEHRFGLLCVGVDPWCGDYWILSPGNNYADSFLIGCQRTEDGWRTYSDDLELFDGLHF